MTDETGAAARAATPQRRAILSVPWRAAVAALAFVCLVAVSSVALIRIQELANADQMESHTYQVLLELSELLSKLKDAENGSRGYIITGQDSYLKPYNDAAEDIGLHLAALRELTADNPAQQQRISEIGALMDSRLRLLRQVIDMRRAQGFSATQERVLSGHGHSILDAIRKEAATAEAEEQHLLAARSGQKRHRTNQTLAALGSSAVISIGLLLGVFLLLWREIAQRKGMAKELESYQANLESLIQVRTAELRQSEARLKTLIDHAPAALAMFDRSMHYLAASRRWLEDFRLAGQRILGISHYEVFRQLPEAWKEAHRRGLAGEVVRGEGDRFEHADGSVLWTTWEIRPWYEANGTVGGIVIFSEDVTERRRAEAALEASRQRFAGIVESAMDAIVTVDAEQRVVLFNQAAETMFQCPAGEALGASFERFIPARFRAAHGQHIARFDQTGITRRTMGQLGKVYGVRADGTEFPIEASISQIAVDGERFYTVILRDISARLAAEEEIRRMNAELEARVEARTAELRQANEGLQEANRELEAYAYAVSHDLRAPLRAIKGFAGIIAADYRDRLDETGRQHLEQVIGGANRMGELIDGLLQLSRSARGDLIYRQVDLSSLAQRILADSAKHDPNRTVHWEIEEGLTAYGDPRMLEAMLRNLFDNAWKYTSKTENPQIRFYLDRHADPPHFCVADNGAGFDMAHARQLFQPFRRLHNKGEFEGIGIGLATVQRIVHRHGGSITARAEPGKGACFCFILPAGGGAEDPADKRSPLPQD